MADNKKLLIVDDDPDLAKVLDQRLTALGYEVVTAGDGVAAFEKLNTFDPALIILDVLMPKISGYEVMRRIREEKKTRDIPVIIISGKGSMKEFFSGFPAVDFIQKPFDSQVLHAKIETFLGAIGKGLGAASRRAVIVGNDDAILEKIRTFLASLGFQVCTGLHEEDAFNLAKNLRPEFILCQFWEDENIFDARKLAKQVSQHHAIGETPFYVFCKEGLSLDAMKTFKDPFLITYRESKDILLKLGNLIKASKPA
ncbi:MAG TPA: response regulator [Candidatus Omnitrophota bacterium]|nr:response regulator [Candidatus Omnitrophota bacterium]HPS37209.1 response regulator [Candidatus Omnitrophota bacterium]